MAHEELRTWLSPPDRRNDAFVLGVVQHAVGSALVLAAWALAGTGQDRAASSALLPGFLIFGLSAASRVLFRNVLERAIALLGAWTVVAPWSLGFAANDAATWTHMVLGALAFAAAAASLSRARTR